KDRRLAGWGREAEAAIGERRGAAAAGRALEEALLDEVRLVHVLQRTRVLADRHGDGAEPHRPAPELLDYGGEDAGVHVVEAELVHVEPRERGAGDRLADPAVAFHLCVIAHPAQQPVGHARGAPAPAGDLAGA